MTKQISLETAPSALSTVTCHVICHTFHSKQETGMEEVGSEG